MSFGYSVGDFLAVGQLAWNVYKSCRDAPESFKDISTEVLSLHAVLKEVEEILPNQPASPSTQNRLKVVTQGCESVLSDLQALVDKYESLGSMTKRTWDRMKWGSEDIAELRARLTSNTVMLTAFISTSQVSVERRLNKLAQEFQEGKYEGSVISTITVESLAPDEKATWRSIRKELENVGISVAAFDTNKTFIIGWIQSAIENGQFDEQNVDDGSLPDTNGSEPRSPVDETDETIDRGESSESLPHQENVGAREEGQGGHLEALSAIEGKEQLPKSRRTHKPTDGDNTIAPLKVYRTTARQPPAQVPPRPKPRRPRLVALVSWALRYQKALSDTCRTESPDNGPKIRSLLAKGAEIDKKTDGFTPLAFALRGKHWNTVALLLQNGADINGGPWALEPLICTMVTTGNKEAITFLLNRGANIEAISSLNASRGVMTPLALASYYGRWDIVEHLLQLGANPNYILTGLVELPLIYAIWRADLRGVEILLDHGASVDTRSHCNFSALSLALNNKLDDIAALLLSRGARMEPGQILPFNRDEIFIPLWTRSNHEPRTEAQKAHEETMTQLHSAVAGECVKTIKLMLENGVDVEAVDFSGLTPLDVAMRNSPRDITDLLLSKMDRVVIYKHLNDLFLEEKRLDKLSLPVGILGQVIDAYNQRGCFSRGPTH